MVAGLEEGVLDIVIHQIHFVSSQGRVAESVHMGFQSARDSLGDYIRSDVEILQSWVSLVLTQNQFVLFHNSLKHY